eukprot:TRINITY_DN11987_c0_g3_i2.p1 TRINITY_DN11987_c0_g3~~TRINITY_DN11987_c0_g3_i2.p1  ORF type:complete len:643 (-),score=78.72 TRINITY_DN11987_c0_g3_i2:23-1951(-)
MFHNIASLLYGYGAVTITSGLLAYLWMACRRLRAHWKRHGCAMKLLRSQCAAVSSRAYAVLSEYLRMRSDPLQVKAMAMVTERRLQNTISIICLLVHGYALAGALTVFYQWSRFAHALSENAEIDDAAALAALLGTVIVFATFIAGWPQLVGSFTLHAMYFAILGLMCTWQTASVDGLLGAGSTTRDSIIVAARVATGAVMSHPRLSCACNLGYAIARITSYLYFVDGTGNHVEGVANPWFEKYQLRHLLAFVVTELALVSIAVIPALCIELQSFYEACSMLKAMQSSSGESTVTCLLASMADAVVTTDENLVITSPSPQFADLLMRQPVSNSCAGNLITSYIREDDRRRVAELLLSCTREKTVSFTTSAVDVGSKSVRVQMYCTPLLGPFSQAGYRVGVVEVKSEVDGPPGPLAASSTARMWDLAFGRDEEDSYDAVEVDISDSTSQVSSPGASSACSVVSCASSSRSLPLGVSQDGVCKVWFECANDLFKIHEASAAFTLIAGPSMQQRELNFADLVDRKVAAKLGPKLRDLCAANISRPEGAPVESTRYKGLKMHPKAWQKAKLRVLADAIFEPAACRENGSNDVPTMVQVTLFNLREDVDRKGKKEKRSDGTQRPPAVMRDSSPVSCPWFRERGILTL